MTMNKSIDRLKIDIIHKNNSYFYLFIKNDALKKILYLSVLMQIIWETKKNFGDYLEDRTTIFNTNNIKKLFQKILFFFLN